jgi:methyl-accepting chemotaxis protein
LLLVSCIAITAINNYEAKVSLEEQLTQDLLPAKLDSILRVLEQELIPPVAGLGVAVNDPFFRKWLLNGENESERDVLFELLAAIKKQFNTNGCNFVSNRSKQYYNFVGGNKNVRTLDERDSWFEAFGDSKRDTGINVYVDDPTFGSTAFINKRIDLNGEYLGFISTALPVETFVKKITSMVVGSKGATYMVDKKGVIRIHENVDYINNTNLKELPGYADHLSELLSSSQLLFKYDDAEGETWFVISRYVPELDWYLVTRANESELYSGLNIALYTALSVALLMLVLGVTVGYFFVRSISRSLKDSVADALSISTGDINIKVNEAALKKKDEIGELSRAFSQMGENLKQTVHSIRGVTEQVASGSQELASSSQIVSDGATTQAANVEEVSSSMEEMTSSIKQNAENAALTQDIAEQAAKDATTGGEAVAKTVLAMEEIAEKISIVEDIARQTNLLALNAAIEAARAGEHGKGFAVVAAEVRKLAERSGVSAQEISELSVNSVSVAKEAGDMLDKIVPNIKRTAELVDEIAASSSEQNDGATQINAAIQQLDHIIQSNASASEEIASTSEELASQSDSLRQAVGFFKTGEDHFYQTQVVRKAPTTSTALPHSDDFERF